MKSLKYLSCHHYCYCVSCFYFKITPQNIIVITFFFLFYTSMFFQIYPHISPFLISNFFLKLILSIWDNILFS